MKKMQDIKKQKRPREKLIREGAEALTNKELLMVLLGSGTKDFDVVRLSSALIRVIGSRAAQLRPENFMVIRGVGAAKAALLCAALELGKRLSM